MNIRFSSFFKKCLSFKEFEIFLWEKRHFRVRWDSSPARSFDCRSTALTTTVSLEVFRNRKFIRDFTQGQPQKHGFLFTLKYCLKKNCSTCFIWFIGSAKVFHEFLSKKLLRLRKNCIKIKTPHEKFYKTVFLFLWMTEKKILSRFSCADNSFPRFRALGFRVFFSKFPLKIS